MKNPKPRRHQEEQANGKGPNIFPTEMHIAMENEKNGEDDMRYLYREMEDWYREEENHRMAGTV
jgi:hypothetical protein